MKVLQQYFLAMLYFMAFLSFNAHAHDDAYLDQQKSPHGGQVRMAGAYHFELVLTSKNATVYVTDHAGTAIKTDGAMGNVIILANKQKTSLELKAAAENSLQASGDYETSPDMKVVVSVKIKGQEMQQARFTPWEKMNHQ